jgi:hypothetical protein
VGVFGGNAPAIVGQLNTVHDVRHASILVGPDHLRLRESNVAAFRPHPEGACVVGSALHALEARPASSGTCLRAVSGRRTDARCPAFGIN